MFANKMCYLFLCLFLISARLSAAEKIVSPPQSQIEEDRCVQKLLDCLNAELGKAMMREILGFPVNSNSAFDDKTRFSAELESCISALKMSRAKYVLKQA